MAWLSIDSINSINSMRMRTHLTIFDIDTKDMCIPSPEFFHTAGLGASITQLRNRNSPWLGKAPLLATWVSFIDFHRGYNQYSSTNMVFHDGIFFHGDMISSSRFNYIIIGYHGILSGYKKLTNGLIDYGHLATTLL